MPHPLYDFCRSMCRLIVRRFMINSKMNISTTEHDTVKTLHQLTHTQMYILMISISHTMKNTPKLAKSPYYNRLGVLPKFCHFCNVLKTLNNLYQ